MTEPNLAKTTPKRIMLVAGEQSGDILGAALIKELKKHAPNCEFFGIGGDRMIAEGFRSLYPIDRLSVMGFVEPLKRLPELLRILSDLKSYFKNEQSPDIFIGIDSPDFNIRLELAAKKNHIFSSHYVSPSVWAWRQGRVKKIKKAVDLMLTLLPFEADFYRDHQVPVEFVGHPLADELPEHPDRNQARATLNLPSDGKVCALMPGSRQFEVKFLLPLMVDTATILRAKFPELEFVIPAANEARLAQINEYLGENKNNIRVIDGCSHEVMCAANCLLIASGTTSLEATLLKRPMVICYKWPPLTWQILKRLVKVPWVGLPNLLAGREISPELLQDKATPENMVDAVLPLLEGEVAEHTKNIFADIHHQLKRNASESAANALLAAWRSKACG